MDLSSRTNRVIFFFITWIGGIFGIHWFVQRNYKKGLLYLLTFGGFMFCWMYDLFVALINIFSYKQERFSKQKMSDKKEAKISNENNKQTILSTKKEQSSNVTITKGSKKNNESLQKTLFLYSLSFSSASSLKSNDEYRRYLIYKYGIDNPQNFHKKMIEEGYFEPLSIENTLLRYKVDYLKDILKTFNLKPSGKKSDLINMVINFIPNDKLIEIVNKNPFYTLSSKGKKYLEDNYEYILIHNHSKWNINITEYNRVKSQLTNATFYDIAWGILNDRSIKEYFAKDFSALSSTYFHMFELLEEENKIDQAYIFLLQTFYIDLSGVDNILNTFRENIFDKNEMVNYINKYYEAIFTFAPAIIRKIIDYKDYYSDTLTKEVYTTLKLPYSICPIELFKEIIHDLFTNSVFDKDKYLKILKNNYIKFIKTASKSK